MRPSRPYRLAEWYREFASGQLPYADVAQVVARHVRRVDPGAVRVLEVACGTGSLTIPLARQGFDVTGLDVSPEMLEVARRRTADAGLDVEYICRDLRDARDAGQFDAVVCFYGGLNYLTSAAELSAGLAAIRAALHPAGAFVFDQFDELPMRRLFSGHSRVVRNGTSVATRSRCLADGRIAHRVTVERAGRREVELHRLRIHPLSELSRLLREVGFDVVGRSELSAELGGCLDLADDYLLVARAQSSFSASSLNSSGTDRRPPSSTEP